MDNLALISLLCVFPSLLLLFYIYIEDKIEKEPIYLLVFLFIGGIVSCVISLFLYQRINSYMYFLNLPYNSMSIFQIIFKVLIAIAAIEEITKWLINYFITWNNKNFNYMYDSIVYSTFVSLGFATLENILYGIVYNTDGILPIVMRGLMSVPSHAVFGVFMGYYLGIAKNAVACGKIKQSHKYRILSIVVPICLHFIYNLFLIEKNVYLYLGFIVYIIILYIFANRKIKRISTVSKNISS